MAGEKKACKGGPLDGSPLQQVQLEMLQGHGTRRGVIEKLEGILGRAVVTYFTSFDYPVMIDDEDVDIMEGILRSADLSNGLALMVSSPGGNGLAAERIVNLCRNYSGTGDFWAIVPAKAKSAATMICFGASKIFMGPSSELGPVDPQLIHGDRGVRRQFSVFNLVKSYETLFQKAVAAEGNLQPFLQQLNNYDEREIEEFRSLLALTDDYAVRTLKSGMMSSLDEATIRDRVSMFIAPETKKVHGRPIFRDEALQCGLAVESVDESEEKWGLVYELYIRTNRLVSTRASKCLESKCESFLTPVREENYDES